MAEHTGPLHDVAGYVLGVLEPDDAAAFEAHLRRCAACRAEVADLAPLTAALDQAAPAVDLPPGLAARTFAAVEHAATAAAARDVGRRSRRALLGVAIAATAVAALVAALLVAWPSEPARARRVTLVSDVAGRTGHVALQRTKAGIVIDLAVEGLAPSGEGEHYECWYLSAADSPPTPERISAGTFTVDADGRARVRMTTAADPAEYPRIAVTRQHAGADPAALGEPVLWSRWPGPAGSTVP